MLQYTLELTLCWALLYLIFFVFLRKETYFSINRWYLLISIFAGILIPLLRFIDIDFGQNSMAQSLPIVYVLKDAPVQMSTTVVEVTRDWSSLWSMLLWSIYLLGVVFFLMRLAQSLHKIRALYKSGNRSQEGSHTIVTTNDKHLPFSFLNCVYISGLTELSEDYTHILEHELSHVKSRHSLDVLFVEFINIVFWFHPMVYVYKTALRQTHEYLADHAVLQRTSKKIYGTMLLKQSLSGLEIALAHHFFHSHIKKRINMMYQKKSGPSAWLKYALALPVLLFLTVVFAKQSNPAIASDINQISQDNGFDKEEFIKRLNEMSQQKKGLQNLQFDLTDYIKAQLVRYPTQKTEILKLAASPLEEKRILMTYKGISLQDPEVNTAGYKLDQFEVVIVAVFADATMSDQFEELNGATPVPDLERLQLMYENSPQRGLNEKAKAVWVYNMYAHEFSANAFKLKALDQQMTQFLEAKGLDLGISMDKLHPRFYESAPRDLRNYADLTRMDDVPIIWNEALSKGQKIGISMDLDQPIQSMIHLSPSDAIKVFGADGDKGFYSIMGYQLPLANPQKQNQLLRKDVANFFSTIHQWPEKDWVNKLKTVHKDLQKKFPKVSDVITPFTTLAHQHNITLVIKNKEIISAYKGDGDSTVRIDEEQTIIKYPDTVKVEEIFKVVEVMPRFPGCEDTDMSDAEKKSCADKELLEYLYSTLTYPELARKNEIQGRVYIQFIVERDGSISGAKVVRDVGSGLGQAALEVVENMNNLPEKWAPGKQRGQPVRVMYTLPVSFQLEGGENPLLPHVTKSEKTKYIDQNVLAIHNQNVNSTHKANLIYDDSPKIQILEIGDGKVDFVFNSNQDIKTYFDLINDRSEVISSLSSPLNDGLFSGSFTIDKSTDPTKLKIKARQGKTTIISPLQNEKHSSSSSEPLYVINGVIKAQSSMEKIHPSDIESIQVLKNETATNKYGEKGVNGVLEITLKESKSINNTEIDTIVTFDPETYTESVEIIRPTSIRPLFVVDGIIRNDSDIEELNPDDIEAITVLKDESAIKKYGQKGENGVIEITLKKKRKKQ